LRGSRATYIGAISPERLDVSRSSGTWNGWAGSVECIGGALRMNALEDISSWALYRRSRIVTLSKKNRVEIPRAITASDRQALENMNCTLPSRCAVALLCWSVSLLIGCTDASKSLSDPLLDCRGGSIECGVGDRCQHVDGDGWRCAPNEPADFDLGADDGASGDQQGDAESGEAQVNDAGKTDGIHDASVVDGAPSLVDAGPMGSGADGGDATIDGGDSAQRPDCPRGFANGEIIRDVSYAGLDPRQAIDLYLTEAPGPNPLIIWIHGGAWRAGSKDGVNRVFLDFRERGYSVASIGYRLSTSPWPATVADVKAAVRFLRSHAADYRLDPDRFVAMGASAGGHLVAMLGTSAEAELFTDPELGDVNISDRVQAVVNFFGPTDLDEMDNDAVANGCPDGALCHDCPDSPESQLIDCQPSQCTALADQASPVDYVDGDEPPFLTFHGEQDCTVPTPQGERLHQALLREGRLSDFVAVPDAGHSVNQCLGGDNLSRLQAFIERTVRGCEDRNRLDDVPDVPQERLIGDCLWESCPALALACEANPPCVELEACFQECFGRAMGNCIGHCLANIPDSAAGRIDHQPLFECGNPAGCYQRR
jgi:acetyl esterase/lipase